LHDIEPSMSFSDFLQELFAEGRVVVGKPDALSDEELQAGERVLREQEEIWRLELPAGAPSYCSEAAVWAASRFYAACQIAVFRDVGDDAIVELTKAEPVDWQRADVHYSVDLTFRFLPDLVRIAHSAAADDPLVGALRTWCRRWPLSSVGVADICEIELGPIVESTSLMQLYVDRIIAQEDVGRLASPPVREAVRRSLGMYPELAPKFRQMLGVEKVP
jgi:hypothetical protein